LAINAWVIVQLGKKKPLSFGEVDWIGVRLNRICLPYPVFSSEGGEEEKLFNSVAKEIQGFCIN
jgi:hypothetical protein